MTCCPQSKKDVLERNEDRHTVRQRDRKLQLALSGDVEALGCLLVSYRPHLYRAALHVLGTPQDAEEALQDAFVQVVRHFREFEGRSRFSTWLTRIVLNAALMYLRKNRKHAVVSIDQESPTGGDAPLALKIADSRLDPEEACVQAERLDILERTLLQLPAPYRSTLLLRDFEGLPTDKAAGIMRISQGTFKSRLHRARRMVVGRGRSAVAARRELHLGEAASRLETPQRMKQSRAPQ
jgi:RNA polymerase sigma-70 factor (ECF subfamily)